MQVADHTVAVTPTYRRLIGTNVRHDSPVSGTSVRQFRRMIE